LNSRLTRVLQSSYVAGGGYDQVNALAIHPLTGEVLVAGKTQSSDLPCTVASLLCNNGAQASHAAVGGGAGEDGFVARLNANLTSLLQATYLGGSRDEEILAMAVHPVSGEVLVAGYTLSTNFPCASTLYGCANGAQPANAGGTSDGFIARLSADLTLDDNMPDAFAFAPQTNVPPASVRTSNPALIAGINGTADIYVDGQPGSAYCVSSTNSCATCDVSGSFIATRSTIAPNKYVCVRHTASAALDRMTNTDLHVGGAMASFLATTGTLLGGNCTLDVDGNSSIDALTDGLMLLRAMFGLTGTPVTNGAIGSGATRTTWAQIRPYLNGNCGTSFGP
jgi:hypothetical protein